jgi:hypothetical protein
MRGTEVTPEQMEAASAFLKNSMECPTPAPGQVVEICFDDLLRLVAWYGAVRYKGALDGIGDEGRPGMASEVKR